MAYLVRETGTDHRTDHGRSTPDWIASSQSPLRLQVETAVFLALLAQSIPQHRAGSFARGDSVSDKAPPAPQRAGPPVFQPHLDLVRRDLLVDLAGIVAHEILGPGQFRN